MGEDVFSSFEHEILEEIGKSRSASTIAAENNGKMLFETGPETRYALSAAAKTTPTPATPALA